MTQRPVIPFAVNALTRDVRVAETAMARVS
jgi:hypothetical protein